jgi:hypothetical protein
VRVTKQMKRQFEILSRLRTRKESELAREAFNDWLDRQITYPITAQASELNENPGRSKTRK